MHGCLAVAHSNLYILSTLGGPNYAAQGLNEDQLRRNLNLATDVYISRVHGEPSGEASIKPFKGACGEEAKNILERRKLLNGFLSGKSTEKEILKESNPELYRYFEKVWTVFLNHRVAYFSKKYFLVLRLCSEKGCPHQRCTEGNKEEFCWFDVGPPPPYFPLPVSYESKQWGVQCDKCKGEWGGHYLKPGSTFKRMESRKSKQNPHLWLFKMHLIRL